MHILVKPTRPDLVTNLIVNTDHPHLPLGTAFNRKDLHGIGLLAVSRRPAHRVAPAEPGRASRRTHRVRHRSRLDQFPLRHPGRQSGLAAAAGLRRRLQGLHRIPNGIAQGEMPPLFVIGPAGGSELVNYRVSRNYYIVDRLFARLNFVSATRTARGASASSAPMEGRDHDDGRVQRGKGTLHPSHPCRQTCGFGRATERDTLVAQGSDRARLRSPRWPLPARSAMRFRRATRRRPARSCSVRRTGLRRRGWRAYRRIMPGSRGRRLHLGRHCPAISAGRCSMRAPRRPQRFRRRRPIRKRSAEPRRSRRRG